MLVSRVGVRSRGTLRRGSVAGLFLALSLTAGPALGGDNAAFVSYTGVPDRMLVGEKASVTVTMLNNGTTTWARTVVTETTQQTKKTTTTTYGLNSVGADWGVRHVAVSGSVAPNKRRGFPFTITAPKKPGTYVFQWRMARDTFVLERPIVPAKADDGFGAKTARKMIVVVAKPPPPPPDTAPTFGKGKNRKKIENQEWLRGVPVQLTLPPATGGDGDLSYALACSLPGGVTFKQARKLISGTPTAVTPKTSCTWKVTDSDTNTAESDSDKLTFTIAVKERVLVVDPASLTVEEDGSGTFTAKLSAKPTGTVSVSVTVPSKDARKVTVIPKSLTFTTANYGSPRTVTVTGVQDADTEDETASVKLNASGGGYGGISTSVEVMVKDGDYPPPVVNPRDLRVREGGPSKGFTVRLAKKPTDTVTVSVTSKDAGAVAVSTTSLIFTTSNWNRTQPVTVTGVQDDDTKDEATSVDVEAKGGGYDRNSTSVDVKVEDDDDEPPGEPALVVSSSSLGIDEGKSGAFTVNLATKPSGRVTVSVTSDDAGAASVTPARLTFTASNHARKRIVTVTGVEDDDFFDETVTIKASASGGGYDNVSASVTVTVKDDEEPPPEIPGLVVNPSSLGVKEGGSRTFTVHLATRPSGRVTVSLTSGDAGAASVNPASLTFTASNHSAARAVTVTGEQDADATDENTSISLSASGGGYDDVSASVRVTVEDDDEPAPENPELKVTPASLGIAEGGSGAFTVTLSAKPSAAVTVSVVSGDPGAASVDPAFLTFTASNHGTARTVTVLGEQDADAAHEETAVALSASGGGYDKVSASVDVTVRDDEAPALLVSPEKLDVAEGDSGSFAVRLSTKPTSPVLVSISVKNGDGAAASVNPPGLTFTPENYAATRSVPIPAPEDADAEDESLIVALSASGGGYDDVSAKVEVTVRDDDAPVLVVDPAKLEVEEGDSDAFTVKLATKPSGSVTVSVTSGDVEAATVTPANLTFAAADYATARTVTVTGGRDANRGDRETAVRLRASGGGYGGVSASVGVTVTEPPYDDASFVSYVYLYSRMTAGSSATVMVRMKNTGTTTWTSAAGYRLGSQGPPDNATWGLKRVALPSETAPGATVDFTLEITAPAKAAVHKFQWRMIRGGEWFGSAAESREITVEEDVSPSFGDTTIPDQTWVKGRRIDPVTFPYAHGGNGELVYWLSGELPAGVTFKLEANALEGTPTATWEATTLTYAVADAEGDRATLTFTIEVTEASSTEESSTAAAGGFDMFEYWLLPHGGGMKVRGRVGDEFASPAESALAVRSFWRGDLWGRKVALLGDAGGERYDIFEEVEDGLDYWGAFEGGAAGAADRPSWSLDRPFRWMNRFMAVGDALESPVTGRLLSDRWRNQESVVEATMRVEVLSHRASYTIPAEGGPTFEDVLAVRFWPDVERPEAHETFHLARGFGVVHWRRSEIALPEPDAYSEQSPAAPPDEAANSRRPEAALPEEAAYSRWSPAAPPDETAYSRRAAAGLPEEVVEWWAVEKVLTPVAPSAPAFPWYDPFSPGWPKTAVLNGNLEDERGGDAAAVPGRGDYSAIESGGGEASDSPAPGWRFDSADAMIGPTPPGLPGGSRSLLLRGLEGGGDDAADAATTEEWIPVAGGTYRLSACMLRENAADNVLVDFDDGGGRDGDFADAHLVAAATGVWECGAVTKCIPASVGAVRVRAAREGANLGDAWFDRIELKRIAACAEPAAGPPLSPDDAALAEPPGGGATANAEQP